MSEQERNIETVKQGYQAFAAGDLDTLMNLMDDNCEWIQPGQSTISGTYRGHQQIQELFQRLTEKSTTVIPTQFLTDGDTVAVVTDGTLAGEPNRGVQVLTLRNNKIIRSEAHGDTGLLERVYGPSRTAASQTNS